MKKPKLATRLATDVALARKVEDTRPSAWTRKILGNTRTLQLMALMRDGANCGEWREHGGDRVNDGEVNL